MRRVDCVRATDPCQVGSGVFPETKLSHVLWHEGVFGYAVNQISFEDLDLSSYIFLSLFFPLTADMLSHLGPPQVSNLGMLVDNERGSS